METRNPQSATRTLSRPPFIIHHLTTIGSTNDYLKELSDAPEFTCVVADTQTAGRGRRSRSWHSTPGDGLYLSILMRPQSASPHITLISLMAAIAVAEALIQADVPNIDIKWPNDVLANDKKICGILVEVAGVAAGQLRVVVGIGVNLNHRAFPADLVETATSIAIETGTAVTPDAFRDGLLKRIDHWYRLWSLGKGSEIVARWTQLSTYATNRQVVVTLDDEQMTGKTAGLTETGALRLKTSDGEFREILSGEVIKVRDEKRERETREISEKC